MAVAAADVRAERTRILATLLDRIEEVIDRALETIRAEIPAYAAQDERFFADVREQVGAHYRTKLACLMEDHDVRLEDISFARGAAMRRARAGFALEDYINAFRVGQQVFWEALVEVAGEGQSGHEAALGLATPVMRYVDFASTHAGHAYVEFHQHLVADADRERRDLLERLLAGDAPTHGPLAATARAHGIGPGTPLLVAAAVAASPPGDGDGDAPHAASAAIARSLLGGTRALVVVRQTEIVAVVALGPGTGPARVCERLHAVHARLREEGLSLAAGVSTVAAGPGELPRAYQEARAALECVADRGGLAALPRLSPLGYLALQAGDTARRLVDPRVRAFLAEDRARDGRLRETIRALADSDLRLHIAAEQLQIHPNTARYRLRCVQERSGRDPRRVADLIELLVAMALEEGGLESVREHSAFR
jgi:diguanylate cyclase with GGDEF domain/PucR-like helix-turn-helix protein